jgi:hypothetical protein
VGTCAGLIEYKCHGTPKYDQDHQRKSDDHCRVWNPDGNLREVADLTQFEHAHRVVERLQGDEAERAGLVASQLLGLALCRYILKIPPVAEMSAQEIVKHIGPTIQRYASGKRSIRPVGNMPPRRILSN